MAIPTHHDDDPLLDLQQVAQSVLIKSGVKPEEAQRLALQLRDAVQDSWGGQQIYIKKTNADRLTERDLAIYAEFNGRNYYELAKKHNLTVQYIYAIVKQLNLQDRRNRQPELFPRDDKDEPQR